MYEMFREKEDDFNRLVAPGIVVTDGKPDN
jgi:hypothetical protein